MLLFKKNCAYNLEIKKNKLEQHGIEWLTLLQYCAKVTVSWGWGRCRKLKFL